MSDDVSNDVISLSAMAYFRERFRNRLYDLIARELAAFTACGFKQADLARKLDKGTDQISRWLSGPGNMTIDTVSDLLLGLTGGELVVALQDVRNQPSRTIRGPDWLIDSLKNRNNNPLVIVGGEDSSAIVSSEPISVDIEDIGSVGVTEIYEVETV